MGSESRSVCALAIGGLDPGGGAGVAADLRAFAAAGAFGCAVVAVMTVQSTAGMLRAWPLPARDVVAQAREVLAHQRVRAIKVGALGSAENVRAVAKLLARHADLPAVVDTPIRPTRGRRARLLADDAVEALRRALLPRATLLTVNADEASALLGARVVDASDAHDAALALRRLGARAVLVKGGHLADAMAIDVLAIDDAVVELRAKRLEIPPIHGAGCTFASLVAGRAALRGFSLDTVKWAKRVHHAALARYADAGDGLRVLVF